MTPAEQRQLLQAIEEKDARLRRRADWYAWASVVLAGAVLAVMIGVATSRLETLNQQAVEADGQLKQKVDELTAKQRDLDRIEALLQRKQEEYRGLQAVVDTLPDQERTALVNRTIAEKPQVAGLLPRIYMQIVSSDDRARADRVGQRLRDAGYLVLGVELRADAAGLKRTEVRFYKKAEQPEAERIRDVMIAAGETDAGALHLAQYENNTRVRPNHFEVWLAARR